MYTYVIVGKKLKDPFCMRVLICIWIDTGCTGTWLYIFTGYCNRLVGDLTQKLYKEIFQELER